MERHHATGSATIVALMAAHRAAADKRGEPAAYDQDEVALIELYLHEDKPGGPSVVTSNNAS